MLAPQDEYNNLVAGRDGRLVAVFYTAGWCAELCATIGRVFEDFPRSDHYSNLIFLKVSVFVFRSNQNRI